MLSGQLLLILQDPAQIIAPSEACFHPQIVIIFFGSPHSGYTPELRMYLMYSAYNPDSKYRN